jgi:hypothetical protein
VGCVNSVWGWKRLTRGEGRRPVPLNPRGVALVLGERSYDGRPKACSPSTSSPSRPSRCNASTSCSSSSSLAAGCTSPGAPPTNRRLGHPAGTPVRLDTSRAAFALPLLDPRPGRQAHAQLRCRLRERRDRRNQDASAGTERRTRSPGIGDGSLTFACRIRVRSLHSSLISGGIKLARARTQPATKQEFKCPECGRTFARAAALGAHRRQAHGVVGTSRGTTSAGRRRRTAGSARRTGATATGGSSASNSTRTRRTASTDGRRRSRTVADRDALLRGLFPNGIPPREDVIRAVNVWLDEAERLARLA